MDIRPQVLIWLGFWRDRIPAEAVAELQELLAAFTPAEPPQQETELLRAPTTEAETVADLRDDQPADSLLPCGNWHAIEGPNGMCACGTENGHCGERLREHVERHLISSKDREAAIEAAFAAGNRTSHNRELALRYVDDARRLLKLSLPGAK